MTNPWNERYESNDYYYGTEPNDFLKENAGAIASGGKVLCLAEGEGRNAVYLAGLGYAVTAVDGSSVGLQKMHRLAGARNVKVDAIVSDLADFSIEPSAWDGIVSIWCHLPRELRKKIHRDVARGLRPGGVLILEAYHPRQLEFKTGGPPDANLMMMLADLREELSGLEFLIAREIEREVREGKGHHGKSAVTQVVCKKRETC